MSRLFDQVDILYKAGARSFVFLNLPPLERTPKFASQTAGARIQIKNATGDYNSLLFTYVDNFIEEYSPTSTSTENGTLGFVKGFDAKAVFDKLINDAGPLGFVNATGWAEPYENGTSSMTTQVPPFRPVSSYFWLNDLHPLFTVHE